MPILDDFLLFEMIGIKQSQKEKVQKQVMSIESQKSLAQFRKLNLRIFANG